MPMIMCKVRYEGPVPGSLNLSQRRFNELLKDAWFESGKYWHTEFRPKHFTKEGAAEYGYKPRKGEDLPFGSRGFWKSYTGKKQKRFGHTLPLVNTGELRDRSKTANIQPTKNSVRVALSRANKANWHNPHSEINMADELTMISDQEEVILAEVHDDAMQRMLDRIHEINIKFYGANASPTTSVAGFFHG